MNNLLSAFHPCGIEVSQHTLVVALRAGDRDEPLREFPNTPPGHQAVLRFLVGAAGPVQVALESTGLYGLDLALTLPQAGVAVMVANPRAVRHFAQALLQRSKNDQLDAEVLCEFAARMPFVAWRPPSAAALKLVAVARRLRDAHLLRMKTLEEFDFSQSPKISAAEIRQLAEGSYIERAEPVLFSGDCGTEKTHLMTGLYVAACRQKRRVRFTPTAGLVNELVESQTSTAVASSDGTLVSL